jgi:hypothetical protein
MPTVRVWSSDKPRDGEVFVSLERTPLVLVDVRKALPRLKAELQRKYPVVYVDIENRLPRRANPYDPSEVVKAACIVLAIRFTWSAIDGAGKKLGEGVGDELAKHAKRWIRNFGNTGKQKSRKIKR